MSAPSEPFAPQAGRADGASGIRERVAGVLLRTTGRAAPGPDDDLEPLGMDSMARLELLAALEEEFGVELTEDLIQEFRTVNRIARVVRDALLLPARDGE